MPIFDLADRRKLAYEEYGDRNGIPVSFSTAPAIHASRVIWMRR